MAMGPFLWYNAYFSKPCIIILWKVSCTITHNEPMLVFSWHHNFSVPPGNWVVYPSECQKCTGQIQIFKSFYQSLLRGKHKKLVLYQSISILSNGLSLIIRSELNSPLYNQVSDYLDIKFISFLHKFKGSKTPFRRDLNLYFS